MLYIYIIIRCYCYIIVVVIVVFVVNYLIKICLKEIVVGLTNNYQYSTYMFYPNQF